MSTDIIKLKAPAKINLYLNVLKKRADGYHDIETIFEKISLCDDIVLKKRKHGIRLFCRHKDLTQDSRNLGFRAAQALLGKADGNPGVEITIDKKIPVACGLGGGSSDAASVLLGLNRLLSLGLHQRQLLDIAVQLGADVPFFILPAARAVGRGKGEILTPLKLRRKRWYILVIPRLKVSTRRMYQDPRLTLTKRPRSAKIVLRALEEENITSLNKYTYNSFEPVVQGRYKQISKVKKALKSLGVQTTLMSGSGPCVFGICATRREAIKIREELRIREKDWQVIVAKTFM